MSDPGEALDIQALWATVNQLLREGAVNRALWDAAEAAKPLVLEGDLLVLGLEPKDMRHASYLTTEINRSRVRQIMHAQTGQNLDLTVIPGSTLEDWEKTKSRQEIGESEAEARLRVMAKYRGAQAVWEKAARSLTELMGSTRSRAWATARARLLAKSFPPIYEAEQAARKEEPEAEETHERYLNKLLDKVATWTELPPTVVALEYLRFCASQKRPVSP